MSLRTRYILKKFALALIASTILSISLFCVSASMMSVVAASSVILIIPNCQSAQHCHTPKPDPTPTHTPTPIPTHTPTPIPTHTPTPTPTHVPASTPTPTLTAGINTPTSTPTPIGTPVPGGGPVPPTTATAQANQTSTHVSTTQTSGSGLPPGGGPPAGGNSGGSSTGVVFTFAALALALVAFLLYLIPQGQSSLLVRLLSLVLPTSVARRFGTK